MKTFKCCYPKEAKLEKILRKKWEKAKDLPLINVVLKTIKEEDKHFNPKGYLGEDEEKCFQILQEWKNNFEDSYLEKYPWLKRPPIKHKVFRRKKIYLR